MKKAKRTAHGKNQQGSGSRGASIVILLLLAAIVAVTATALYIRPDWRWLVTDALFSSPAGTMPRGEDADALRARGGEFSELSSFTVDSLRDDPRVTENANLMLINPEHLLSADYQPTLATLPDSDMLADPQLCLAFAALAADCEQKTAAAQKLIITSAYRTREEQEAAISEEGERAQSLDASEHQAGLALDLCVRYYGGRSFLKTDAGRYVNSHAAEYGLIMRYPYWGRSETGISFEPWHVRYVGEPHAVLISENRLTLEEYILRLTPGLYFVSGEYLITRQSADSAFLLPDGFASAEISYDNTGYYIITARIGAAGS